MVFAKTVHYTKQQAEQLRQGANSTKTHLSNPLPKKHLDPQELLAWELEQEKWADKSDSAILENPGWQRVGIKFNTSRGQSQSYSGYSSSEEEQSRQSPDVIRSTSSMQMERPYIAPRVQLLPPLLVALRKTFTFYIKIKERLPILELYLLLTSNPSHP